jgi:hypothetical protein
VGRAGSRVDDLAVIPDHGIGKERSDVNAITTIFVQAHIDDLLAEAAKERLARSVKSHNRQSDRFAAIKSVWSNLFGSADQPGSLPTLENYPYRA